MAERFLLFAALLLFGVAAASGNQDGRGALEDFLGELGLLHRQQQFEAQGFGGRPEALALLGNDAHTIELLKEMGLTGAERLVLLDRVARESNAVDRHAVSAASPAVKMQRRRAQQAPEAVSTASFWLKAADGKIVIGPNADVSVFRAGAGVLATGGGFKLGSVDTCAAADDAGTLRPS